MRMLSENEISQTVNRLRFREAATVLYAPVVDVGLGKQMRLLVKWGSFDRATFDYQVVLYFNVESADDRQLVLDIKS
jgi:hypothetical protein